MATNISDLASEINRQLALYANSVSEEVDKVAQKVAKDGVARLKAESPKLTHDYSKGWRVKKVKGAYVIHNKTDYQLTHLLEKGHAIANGTDRVDPRPHIGPVEQDLIRELEQGVLQAVQQ